MTTKNAVRLMVVAMMAVGLAACGGGKAGSVVASQPVGPAGGVVAAGSALQLEIPAGAISHEVEIQIREVEPRQGEVKAFQIEPAELQLEHAVRVKVSLDDASGAGKHHLSEVENEVEHAAENEIEDANEHAISGELNHLGHVGVKRADDAAPHNPEPEPNDAPAAAPQAEPNDAAPHA
jgi:hypothetical protein